MKKIKKTKKESLIKIKKKKGSVRVKFLGLPLAKDGEFAGFGV